MRIILAAFLIAFAGLGLAAGPAAAGRHEAPAPRKLVLEEFFRGPLVAEGEFINSRDGTRRGVKVRMHGSWDGSVLTLVEDFVYADGEKDRKTWRFTKTGEGRYLGTREDVVGQALVTQDGDDIRLTYTATVTTKSGGSYPIRFVDRLTLTGPGEVLNTAALSYLFFDVGQVRLTIRRLGR